jgi:hypothetical protein
MLAAVRQQQRLPIWYRFCDRNGDEMHHQTVSASDQSRLSFNTLKRASALKDNK